MIAQVSIVRRPICPTLVHNDNTRIIICILGLLICCMIYYMIAKKFNN